MARWAVPVFFLISGYFYQKGMQQAPVATFKKSALKILGIFLVANLVYLPVTYFAHLRLFEWKYFLVGNYMQLWFLPSLLLGYIVVYLVHKQKISLYTSAFFSLLIIAAALFGWSYAFVPRISGSNFVLLRSLLSIPFMLIGGYFYKYSRLSNWLKPSLCLAITITGAILQLFEAWQIKALANTPIAFHQFLAGTVLFAVGLFMMALSINLKNARLGMWGKDYSLFIYIYHPMVIFILLKIVMLLHFNALTIFLLFIPVFVITLVIGIAINTYLPVLFLLSTGSINKNQRQS